MLRLTKSTGALIGFILGLLAAGVTVAILEWQFSIFAKLHAHPIMFAIAVLAAVAVLVYCFYSLHRDEPELVQQWIGKLALPLKSLMALGNCCIARIQDHAQLAVSDIKRDIRELKANNRSAFFIASFVLFQSARTFVPILFDGLLRLAAKLLPFGRSFRS